MYFFRKTSDLIVCFSLILFVFVRLTEIYIFNSRNKTVRRLRLTYRLIYNTKFDAFECNVPID